MAFFFVFAVHLSHQSHLSDIEHVLSQPHFKRLLRLALEEDVGTGDITSKALLDPRRRAQAYVLAQSRMIISGLPVARAVFMAVDPKLRVRLLQRDGQCVPSGERLIELEGRAASILAAERLALNFLQRMSGIATLTARFVREAGKNGPAILDTRKTAPGMRALDKYAVACGGGVNHRMGLFDRILIKDNHRLLWKAEAAGSLAAAVEVARRRYPKRIIEVEVESVEELRDAIRAKPDWILLDNMSPALLRRCVREAAGRCRLEASGGITLQTLRCIARTGIDAISLGCLTHSVAAADVALDIDAGVVKKRRRSAGQ